ncbi:MAG: hypothetical protein GY796_02415 [Chloroflexi bacterium]|nr:hypothetical protein [Chloroflexota bacterium]
MTDNESHNKSNQLSLIVQTEAHRILSEAELAADPELVAAGWERRFVSDGRRSREMITLYTEMGYEVHLEPLQAAEFTDECEDCGLVALLKFVTIYTRKKEE